MRHGPLQKVTRFSPCPVGGYLWKLKQHCPISHLNLTATKWKRRETIEEEEADKKKRTRKIDWEQHATIEEELPKGDFSRQLLNSPTDIMISSKFLSNLILLFHFPWHLDSKHFYNCLKWTYRRTDYSIFWIIILRDLTFFLDPYNEHDKVANKSNWLSVGLTQ